MGQGPAPGNMGKPGMQGMGGAQFHPHQAHPDGSTAGPDDGSGMFHSNVM
jgi:hypothetical protein